MFPLIDPGLKEERVLAMLKSESFNDFWGFSVPLPLISALYGWHGLLHKAHFHFHVSTFYFGLIFGPRGIFSLHRPVNKKLKNHMNTYNLTCLAPSEIFDMRWEGVQFFCKFSSKLVCFLPRLYTICGLMMILCVFFLFNLKFDSYFAFELSSFRANTHTLLSSITSNSNINANNSLTHENCFRSEYRFFTCDRRQLPIY